MDVLLATHDSALRHDTGVAHPERPERVTAVMRGVFGSGLDVTQIDARPIERSLLAAAHDAAYVEMIETFCSLGGGALDMDTIVSRDTWEAALAAVGAVWTVVEEMSARTDCVGFAVTRPPGHHAMRDRAMGFCIFNNVAVTANLLRARGEKVAILDWDVHHGNGTQSIVIDDPGTLYVSLHRSSFYPFDGYLSDIDSGAAKGTTVNVPLPAGTAGDVYRHAWESIAIPVLTQFQPDWVLISAGYDAHVSDPLGGMALVADDFGWMAAKVGAVHPSQRIVAALEGGYDLLALEQSAAMTLMGLAGIAPDGDREVTSPGASLAALDEARTAIGRHWSL